MTALSEEGHSTPTPIQAQTLPPALAGRDVLGIAQTGTGKTAAFALPILHRLAATPRAPAARSLRALILAPTRELGGQIRERFDAYGRHLRLRTEIVIGGVSIGGQARRMARGTDILIATPGRLLDLVESGSIRLNEVEVLVLDEADRMLDMGFIIAIRKIVARLPAQRQNLFFSATMPAAIAGLSKALLRDPVSVAVTPVATTADRVDQHVVHIQGGTKLPVIAALLHDPSVERALVFTRTKRGADRVVRGLAPAGIPAEAIHGNKSQPQRERVMAAFRDGAIRVLVATDIAARGIDVTGISHVFNYDLPNEPESYVHRIGRTARAGAAGIAISLCEGEERAYLRDIERLIRQTIPVMAAPAFVRGSAPEAHARPDAAPQKRHNPRPHHRPARAEQARHPEPVRAKQSRPDAAPAKGQGPRPNRRPARPAAGDGIGAVAFMGAGRKPAPHRNGGQRPQRRDGAR